MSNVDGFLKVLSATTLSPINKVVMKFNDKEYVVVPYQHTQSSIEHELFSHSYAINTETQNIIGPRIYGQFTASDLAARQVEPEIHYVIIERVSSLKVYSQKMLEMNPNTGDVQEAVDWLAGCLWDKLSEYVTKTLNFPSDINNTTLVISKHDTPKMYYYGPWITLKACDPQVKAHLVKLRHSFVKATSTMAVMDADDMAVRKALFTYKV